MPAEKKKTPAVKKEKKEHEGKEVAEVREKTKTKPAKKVRTPEQVEADKEKMAKLRAMIKK